VNLRARQVAIAAGAEGELIEKVAAQMAAEKAVRIDLAENILKLHFKTQSCRLQALRGFANAGIGYWILLVERFGWLNDSPFSQQIFAP